MKNASTHPAGGNRVWLLTGLPGVGKTTVLWQTAKRLEPAYRMAGFYTREMRDTGQR